MGSFEELLTLVGAGMGLGFASAAQAELTNRPDIRWEDLALEKAQVTTFVARRARDAELPVVARFITRARKMIDWGR